MTITSFDRDTVKAIVRDIDAALAAVGEKHGIKVRATSTRYDLAEFSTKVVATIEAAKADSDLKNAQTFAGFLGVDISEPSKHPRALGAKVVGYNHKSRTRPWIYEQGGKRYITTDANMRLMFPAAAK